MQLRATSSGSFASARLMRQITCHPISTSLLLPSSHGFNFRRAFHPYRNITNVNLIGLLIVSPASSLYCPRSRLIERRFALTNAGRFGQTCAQIADEHLLRPGLGRQVSVRSPFTMGFHSLLKTLRHLVDFFIA